MFPQNGPPCVTAYVTAVPLLPLGPGGPGPLDCGLSRQGGNSRQFLFSFKGTTVHLCALLAHSSDLEKNGIWFSPSGAHSRPLKSFHRKRPEFSRSAGEHSSHSALTRRWGHFIREEMALSALLGWGRTTPASLSGTRVLSSFSTESLHPGLPSTLDTPGRVHLLTGNQGAVPRV